MKNPSRKFIDLIYAVSSKYANWDPPREIKVGDYGIVNRETGQFEKEGNIYQNPLTAKLVAPHPPIQGAAENKYILSSLTSKNLDVSISPTTNVGPFAEASIKGHWQFGKRRGALLIMARPRHFFLPPDVVLEPLSEIPLLKEKALVTHVTSCPAYTLYLSSGTNEAVDIALLGSIPVPGAPAVTGGGTIEAKWWSQHANGLFRDGCDPNGNDCYTPLYVLKSIPKRRRRRESPVPEPEGDEIWAETRLPWEPLDEEGEEEVFEDTIFD